jgi:tetratricopeptide (TPR) repeat protein
LRNWLGKIIFEGGRTQEALAYFREAQAINPNNASAYHNIGSVLEQLHLRPEAMASYEKAIALNPDKPEPHISLGRLLLPTDAQGALREFRRALEGNPDSVRAMDNIVWALNSLDRPLEALQAARNALATDANLPASLAIAAGILSTYPDANVRDGRRAVEYANRLCRNTNRSDVAALDILAEAYAEAGLYNQAVAADQEAINLALANRWPELTDQYRQHQQQFRENKPLRRSGGR